MFFKIDVKIFFSIFTGKYLFEPLFNTVAGLQACYFIKNKFQNRCFSVNVANILTVVFFSQNAAGGCF